MKQTDIRRRARIAVAVLLGLLAAVASELRADDAADIAQTIIRESSSRAEAATKILNAARAAKDSLVIQIRLAEMAYEHGKSVPDGYPAAIAALEMLETVSPTRARSWRDKRIDLHRLQYYRSTGKTRAVNGRKYIDLLLAQARSAEQTDNWNDVARYYSQAYQIARALKMPEADSLLESIKTANHHTMLLKRVSAMEKALTENPDDVLARKKLVTTYLVDLDRPSEAAKYLSDKLDPVLRANVALAAKDPATLTAANLFTLGTWYQSLSSKTIMKPAKVRMLTRARDALNLYLDVHDKADAQRLRTTALVKQIEAELTELGAVVVPKVTFPKGMVLAVSFDEGQWVQSRSSRSIAQVKDVSGSGKTVYMWHGRPDAGMVGQAARIRKIGGVNTGVNFSPSPLTVAFWAKADSANSRTMMLFGLMSGSGRFYIGYDDHGLLGIGMGTTKWQNESKGLKLDAEWHHYAVTWDGKTLSVYVDGTPRGQKAEPVKAQGALFVGNAGQERRSSSRSSRTYSRPSPEYGFIGLIDEVAVFPRVLSQAEVQAIIKHAGEGEPLGKL